MDTRKLEKIVKGFANHRRIQILDLLGKKPGLSVFEISEELNVNFKTISEHLRRLTFSGLVVKSNRGAEVEHIISGLGRLILKFLRTLE
ncbi:MAG TPA: winged helix-turn-helix domain-containing protein [Candidatus Paceibacterota bacterium]